MDEWDGMWSLYTAPDSRDFSDHGKNKDRWRWIDETEDGPRPTIALRSKLRAGLAWHLSYRGREELRISDNGRSIDDAAALLVWEHAPGDMGAKTVEDRRKDAENGLQEYNDWANGWVYWYEIETEDGTEVSESCVGFIGDDWFLTEVRDAILVHVSTLNQSVLPGMPPVTVDDLELTFTGDVAWLGDYLKLSG
jgi:hypothetical protein